MADPDQLDRKDFKVLLDRQAYRVWTVPLDRKDLLGHKVEMDCLDHLDLRARKVNKVAMAHVDLKVIQESWNLSMLPFQKRQGEKSVFRAELVLLDSLDRKVIQDRRECLVQWEARDNPDRLACSDSPAHQVGLVVVVSLDLRGVFTTHVKVQQEFLVAMV